MGKIQLELIDTNEGFQILNIFLKGNGVVEPEELKAITLPEGFDARKGIIINGKAPVWLYSYLTHICHIFAWVATFDPRKGAIVTQTHSNDQNIANIIDSDEVLPYLSIPQKTKTDGNNISQNKVIALIGPPNSGKSVLLYTLCETIKSKIGVDEFNKYCFLIRACPDGEGNWFSEISEEQGKLFRYKKIFDDDFPRQIAKHISGTAKTKKITFVDCGGIIDKKNQIILNECNRAIIISSKPEQVQEWIGAAKSSELKIIAIIDSLLDDISIITSEEPLRIYFGKLERHSNTSLNLPYLLIDKIINPNE